MVRKKLNKKKVFLGIIGTLIVVFILTFYIWHQAESIRLGYQKGELEEKVLSLQKEVEKLEAKKSSLLSLERVEKISKEKLNLSEPKKDQIIYENAPQRP